MDEDAARTFVQRRRMKVLLVLALALVLFLVAWIVTHH
jgi:hypothetical protein